MLVGCCVSCSKPVELLGDSDELVAYVLLSEEIQFNDSTLYALVASTSASARLRYRRVDEFQMRRRSDGAVYDWTVDDESGDVPFFETGRSLNGIANVRLRGSGTGSKLGRKDLRGGDTYDLHIVVEGQEIDGVAALRAPLQIELTYSPEQVTASWTRTVVDEVYLIEVTTEPSNHYTSDTSYVMQKTSFTDPPPGVIPRVQVTAMGAPYFAYLADSTQRTVGLTGAYGVFAGLSSATALLSASAADAGHANARGNGAPRTDARVSVPRTSRTAPRRRP